MLTAEYREFIMLAHPLLASLCGSISGADGRLDSYDLHNWDVNLLSYGS